jgi:hypothetical protein
LLNFFALVRHSGFIKSIATAPKLDEEAWLLGIMLFLDRTGIPQQDRRALYKQKNLFFKRGLWPYGYWQPHISFLK